MNSRTCVAKYHDASYPSMALVERCGVLARGDWNDLALALNQNEIIHQRFAHVFRGDRL